MGSGNVQRTGSFTFEYGSARSSAYMFTCWLSEGNELVEELEHRELCVEDILEYGQVRSRSIDSQEALP